MACRPPMLRQMALITKDDIVYASHMDVDPVRQGLFRATVFSPCSRTLIACKTNVISSWIDL